MRNYQESKKDVTIEKTGQGAITDNIVITE